MLYGKFAEKGDNPVDKPSLYNIEIENRLLPGLKPWQPDVCWVFFSSVP